MKRWLPRLAVMLIVLAAVLAGTFQYGLHLLRDQVLAALGSRGEVGQIEVGLDAVVLHDLRIRAEREGPAAWPAEDELRADRVVVVPQLRDLLSARVRIARITVEGGYLSMLRTRQGALQVLPALIGRPADEAATPLPDIHIAQIELRDAALDFFDASVRRTPHRLAFEAVRADLGPVDLPALATEAQLQVDGTVKGPRMDGRFSLQGTLQPSTRALNLLFELRGADLVAFQPYLIQAAETGVKRGTMDLDLRPVVKNGRLRAPGRLTLTGLELASGNTFMGMPRAAVVGLMKDRDGRITADFTLEGRLDDPSFSLNEGLASRMASGVAESLGVSLGGLARGVGSAGASAVKGVGEAVGKLFGD